MPPDPFSWYGLFYLFIPLAIGAYFLFKDTMNRIQYIETIRLFWITRDVGKKVAKYQPRIMKGFMRQTHPPYWRGDGIQFRFHKWTFMVGILKEKAESLEQQVGTSGWLPTDPRELRRFTDDDQSDKDQ